jgi:YVTN family beta-propeller protein
MKIFTPFAALALSALTMSAPAWSQARAYATNEGAGTVSVIDMETDTVLSTIETGGKPRGLAVCKGSPKIYVSEQNAEELWQIDPVSGKIEKRAKLGESPEAVYCSPKGDLLGVANEGNNSISFVSVKTMKVLFSIPVNGKNPEHGVFSPDGRWIFWTFKNANKSGRSKSVCVRVALPSPPMAAKRLSRLKPTVCWWPST